MSNECFLFDIIENKAKDINFEITEIAFDKSEYFYTEVNYSKFTSEHFLIKIYSCKNDLNICIFSETRRIFTENRNTIDNKE